MDETGLNERRFVAGTVTRGRIKSIGNETVRRRDAYERR